MGWRVTNSVHSYIRRTISRETIDSYFIDSPFMVEITDRIRRHMIQLLLRILRVLSFSVLLNWRLGSISKTGTFAGYGLIAV
jgi:hypothetical protein